MTPRLFVFQCSTATYMECVEKGLFGSNREWPVQVATGDYCLLWHYEIGKVFGLWRAVSDGGRGIVPRAWGGRFPFQVCVRLVSSEIVEVPDKIINEHLVDPATGRWDKRLEGAWVDELVKVLSTASREKERA